MAWNRPLNATRPILLAAAVLFLTSPAAASFDLWTGTMDLHGNNLLNTGNLTMDGAIAIGQPSGEALALNDSIALGRGATADTDNAVAIGNQSDAAGDNGIAIGRSASAGITTDSSIAIGWLSSAANSDGIAIGTLSSVAGRNAIALGDNTDASALGAVAIGHNAVAAQKNTTTFGSFQDERYDVNVTGNLSVHGIGGVALPSGVVMGDTATQVGAADAIAIGHGSNASASASVAVGDDAQATTVVGSATAIGSNTEATSGAATALGQGASATSGQSIAIGQNAAASSPGAVAIGDAAVSDAQDTVTLGSQGTPYDLNVTANLSVAELAQLQDYGGPLPACNAGSAGTVGYNGSHWGCDGTNWNSFY